MPPRVVAEFPAASVVDNFYVVTDEGKAAALATLSAAAKDAQVPELKWNTDEAAQVRTHIGWEEDMFELMCAAILSLHHRHVICLCIGSHRQDRHHHQD